MTSIDQAAAPILAAPRPHKGSMSFLEFARAMRHNWLGTFSEEAFERDILVRKLLWRRSFLVNDPAGIKRVLLDNVANYPKTSLTRRLLEPGMGKGLITAEGETWRRHRRIMAPSFDHRSIVSYSPIMTQVAEELIAKWQQLPEGTTIDVSAAMMQATLTVISRTMFSSDSEHIADVVRRGVERYQSEVRPTLADFLGLPQWLSHRGKLRASARALSEFDVAINRLIETRIQSHDASPNDLLGRLLAERDEETSGRLSIQEVRDEVITAFIAGHETTGQALTWAWYLLSQHPAEEAKLHAEIKAVLGGRPPRHEDLAKLTYTRMIIEEAMRLYPPAHTISRTPLADDEICNLRIPRGSTVLISPWVLHRHRRLWERPDVFEPKRFAPERAATRPRFSYLPFGAGPRICLGAAFAMAETMLMLAAIAQHYSLRLAPGHKVEPQGLITLRARYGLKMTIKPRDRTKTLQ
jgi:cytochrome P450